MNQLLRNKSLILLGILLGASAVLSVALERRAQTNLQERQTAIRGTMERLEQLLEENARLSELVDGDESGQAISAEQQKELLALRSEVGQLRRGSPEKERLRASNFKLQASVAKLSNDLAEAQAAPNYWPKEQLTFAGSATPEAAMRSVLWAMYTGNLGQIKESLSPEAVARLLDQWERREVTDERRKAEIEIMAQALTGPSIGFHIVEQKMISTNRAVITLSFDGEGKTRRFVLRRLGNEWKISNLLFVGQLEPNDDENSG